ncbi:MAG: hypothetical protein ACN6NI_06730, partial [Acinetobacter sp.]
MLHSSSAPQAKMNYFEYQDVTNRDSLQSLHVAKMSSLYSAVLSKLFKNNLPPEKMDLFTAEIQYMSFNSIKIRWVENAP